MFKLKYRNNGSVEEVSFDSYRDMVYFVAKNKIADDAVESITLFGEEMTLSGLADKVVNNIDAQRALEVAAESEDEEAEEDEDDFEDEEDESEEEPEEESHEEKVPNRADEVLAWFDNIYNN